MKVLQGYRYSVTANEEVTVTDENGLSLTCPAGQQTYFTATCDEVEVSGDAVVTQARGHITIGSGGGGGGEKIEPGEVIVGGTQGSAFIVHLNECTRCPIFIDEELPEGVTFEKLESGVIAGAKAGVTSSQLLTVFATGSPHAYGSILSATSITQLPNSINFASLIDGSFMFCYCSELASFNSDLPSLTNGRYMFQYCSKLASFNSDLPLLTDGTYMFGSCKNLSEFNIDLPALTNSNNMFYYCTSLIEFNGDLPALTNGSYMFQNCSELASFNSDLPLLTNGERMFHTCSSLTSFNCDLPSLTNGGYMFGSCKNLSEFNIDLSALTNGTSMFYGCSSLTSFNGDLSVLPYGDRMFYNCSKLASFNGDLSAMTSGSSMFSGCLKLASFNSNLSALTSGSMMFGQCKLDLASLTRIVTALPSYTSGSHPITIGVNQYDVTQEQQDNANTILTSKGWTVTWQRNY